jgi:dienelactone hydrolase
MPHSPTRAVCGEFGIARFNGLCRVLQTAFLLSLLSGLTACHHGVPSTSRSAQASSPPGTTLTINGDPESAAGSTWTLIGTLEGKSVDLEGILLKPRGRGPFPAVVLSHPAGGSAQSYGRALGAVMRKWGLVCIATNYTHAHGVALGSMLEQGASPTNTFRAHAVVRVLGGLGYVDVRRIAAHGHSMGAFVTTAFVAEYPGDVRVASHTAGGVVLDAIHVNGMPAPSVAQARRIKTPYQWHHGLRDFAVPFLLDRQFDDVLNAPHEGHLYLRLTHASVAEDPEVLARIRSWYSTHDLFQSTPSQRFDSIASTAGVPPSPERDRLPAGQQYQ